MNRKIPNYKNIGGESFGKEVSVFISSTYENLKEERNKAIQAILTMNQFPIGIEIFSVADDNQWKIIKEAIDSSDFHILIIGNRYGSIKETTGISYTEKEFGYAGNKIIFHKVIYCHMAWCRAIL